MKLKKRQINLQKLEEEEEKNNSQRDILTHTTNRC